PDLDALQPFLIVPGTHDGGRYAFNVGGLYRFDYYSTISATFGFERKTAGRRPFNYSSPYVSADYHELLGRGAYFDLQGGLRDVVYDSPDCDFLGCVKRHDLRTDARAAVGGPLSAFAEEGATGDVRENLIAEAAVSFTDRTSRFPVLPFHSLGGEV